MFVSFDKAFKKNENYKKIPQVILDYLNQDLKCSNLKYVSGEDGRCVITSLTGEYKFSGITFDLSSEMEEILGDNPNIQDVLNYSYNAQKQIPLKMIEDGYIILNDEKIRIDKLGFDPYKELRYFSGSLYVVPQKMDETISIKMSGYQEEMLISLKRVPDNSLDWRAFQSDKTKALSFFIKFNLKEKTMIVNISYDLNKAKNIAEALKIADIYNAFFYGEGKMNDAPISFETERNGESSFSTEKLLYWKKLHDIEEKLDISFKPSEEITISNIYIGEILYRTLICKIPVRVRDNIESVSFRKKLEDIQKAYDINKPLTFYFEEHSRAELLGIEIPLRGIQAVYNCVISKLSEENGMVKLILEDESTDKKKFTVAMYFISDEELEKYRDTHNVIEEFKKAKSVEEYVDIY